MQVINLETSLDQIEKCELNLRSHTENGLASVLRIERNHEMIARLY